MRKCSRCGNAGVIQLARKTWRCEACGKILRDRRPQRATAAQERCLARLKTAPNQSASTSTVARALRIPNAAAYAALRALERRGNVGSFFTLAGIYVSRQWVYKRPL